MRNKLRPIKIIPYYVKSGEGSVLFSMGNTRVLCVVTINENVVPKFCEEKNIGWVTAEYAMLPRSGKQRTSRNRTLNSGRTQEIQRLVGRSLRAVVDLEKLGKRTIIVDCDVIEADGGTRIASINGAYIALTQAINRLVKEKKLESSPIKDYLGAVSVGIVEGQKLLDISAKEDNNADVDMNVVMTGKGKFVEIQSTAEKVAFSEKDLQSMLKMAKSGIRQIINKIKKHTGSSKLEAQS